MGQLNPSIILQGQQPDFVNALARGQEAGARANDIQRTNSLNALYEQQGPGIMSGDQIALNALSRIDPTAAHGFKQAGIDNARADAQLGINKGNLEMRREEEKRKMEAHVATMDANERATAAAETEAKLAEGLTMYQRGDLAGLNGILQSASLPPINSLDEFPAIAATAGDMLEVLQGLKDFNAPPVPLSPQGKAATDLRNGNLTQEQYDAANTPKPSAAEAKIKRLMAAGLSRDIAQGIVDGRYVESRDPVTGTAQIIDKATGGLVGGSNPAEMPDPAQTVSPQTSTMPDGTDFSTATGAGGFLSQLTNTISDALGAGLVDQNNEQATQAMSNLATRTMVTLADGVAGRPSNFLLEQFQALTITPNSVWQGEGRAKERLNQTRDMIEDAIMMNQDVTQSEVTPNMRAQASQNIARLSRLLNDYDAVIASFGSRKGKPGTKTKSGVSWEVVE